MAVGVRAKRDARYRRRGDEVALVSASSVCRRRGLDGEMLAHCHRAHSRVHSRALGKRAGAKLRRGRVRARRGQRIPPEVAAVQECGRDEDRSGESSTGELGYAGRDRTLIRIIEGDDGGGSLARVSRESARERDDVVRAHQRIELRGEARLRQVQREVSRGDRSIGHNVVIREHQHIAAALRPQDARKAAPEGTVLDRALEKTAETHDVRDRSVRQRLEAAPWKVASIVLRTDPRSASAGVPRGVRRTLICGRGTGVAMARARTSLTKPTDMARRKYR